MEENLEKAKQLFGKTFCLMQWQEDGAKSRGEEIMQLEDIEFLLSLQSITHEEIETIEAPFDLKKLRDLIAEGKKKGMKGLMLWNDTSCISRKEERYLKRIGCFVRESGHGSVSWQEVYFSEEDVIRAKVSAFQNLFGSFAGVAHLI